MSKCLDTTAIPNALIRGFSQLALNWSVKDGPDSTLIFEWKFGHNNHSSVIWQIVFKGNNLRVARVTRHQSVAQATIGADGDFDDTRRLSELLDYLLERC